MPGQDLTSKDISVFTQPGGAAPANALKLAGLDGQHLAIGGVTRAVADIKPDYAYDPQNPGQYEARASLTSAPGDFDGLEISAGELSGKVPAALVRDNIPFNLYMNAGTCVDPTNPLAFTGYVEIAANCQISGNDGGDRKMRADDAVLIDKLTVKCLDGLYPVGPLIFGEQQPTAVAAALTFGNRSSNLCGVAGVETKDLYVGIAAAGATVGKLRYSVDGGGAWADLAITGIVNTEVIKAVCVLGQQLIVVTDTAGSATQSGYYVADIDQDTGIPGSTWTKVTAGIAATDLATDAWVEGNALYIVAQKGWIYKTQTPLTGVTTVRSGSASSSNINRISGRNGVLGAVMADGTLLISRDEGATWGAGAAIAVASPLAIGVVDAKRFYVGAASGVLKYTDNAGKTWSTVAYLGTASGDAVNDIQVVTPEVIHLVVTASSVGRIVSTWHGFAKSTNTANRINNFVTNGGMTRAAVPRKGSRGVRANTLAVVGTAAGGTLGSVQVGRAPVA